MTDERISRAAQERDVDANYRAYKAGLARYPDRRFSMQEVRAKPLEFGWFSHVVPGIDANSTAD